MDMNMESRKLIVCAMNMNNANQLKLKFTDTKIVNLEMFSHVRILKTNLMNKYIYFKSTLKLIMRTSYEV
jgi:hypothetical protein